jgi:putative ABC transport system permease protein
MVRLAMRSILRNRMRSLLTMLGIVIGVGAVIALVSVGRGTQASIQADISSLGTNLLMIRPGAASMRGVSQGSSSRATLTIRDVERIREDARFVSDISAVVGVQAQAVAGSRNWSTSVSGVDSSYLGIRSLSLESGRFFTDQEIRSRAKVAVLGRTVVDELFGSGEPIGARIRLGNVPFLVIGVLAEKGESAGGRDQDDQILAPFTTVLYRMSDGTNVNQIIASASSEETVEAAEEEIAGILREEHRLDDTAEDDFVIRSQTDIQETASSVTGTLILLLSAIAAVSLIVGGIGIMNIMLVSVTERTREIGIRLAVGAHSSDVLAQFLVESVILCLIGGLVGIAAGLGTGQLLANLMGVEAVLDAQVIVLATAFSAAVGVFFGFYPARKASRLDPIEALRYE